MNNSPLWHYETIEFWREAEILSKLHHPNVVAFYGVVQDGPGRTLATCSFEGGIAGEPGSEAHGGYDWVVFRQAALECGFQGRTNKLVDGCYSF
ncbi:hypothetical protein IC582_003728 [Cucumis melo]